MENLDDKKSDAAGVCDPGALSRPTDVTGAADVGAASLESGCGESFQSNFGNWIGKPIKPGETLSQFFFLTYT